MRDAVFLIIVTPEGKHRLRYRDAKGEHDKGLYNTHAEALDAMNRIIKPQTSYFNKDGEPLHDVPANQN